MAEQRLIDANYFLEKLSRMVDYCENDKKVSGLNALFQVGDAIMDCPTIDPETLPIVRQLREELALITHQRDVYKSVFERITAHGDCNDCEDVKGCRFVPRIGEDTRYNCPLWRGPRKEE